LIHSGDLENVRRMSEAENTNWQVIYCVLSSVVNLEIY
jgi:hypothetical protein